MKAEFDDYAGNYGDLLKDPLRDRFARDGLFFHERKWDLLQALLSARFADLRQLRWLDVGCGKGELLRFGRSSLGAVAGCDPSVEMIQQCDDLNVVHQSSPADLPFPSGTFDVVTAACVYHHLTGELQDGLTSEAARLLKPGGMFVIFEHNPWNPATRLIVSRTPVDRNAVLLTSSQAADLIERAGLRFTKATYYLYLPEPLYRRIGWMERALGKLPAGGQYAAVGQKV
jgi:SAM-dependent methyltransferase